MKESKTLFRLYGKDRVIEALEIAKAQSPHLVDGLNRVISRGEITPAEVQLCNSMIKEATQ